MIWRDGKQRGMMSGGQTGQSPEFVNGFTSLHFIHTARRKIVLSSSLVQHTVWVVQLAERLHLLSPPVEEILCSRPGPGILLLFLYVVQQSVRAEKGALKEWTI